MFSNVIVTEIDIEVAAFTGSSYLQYTSLNQRNSTVTVVNLAFRTARPDGQLLYNGQDDVTGEGDFIQLRVTSGLLQLRVDLGSFITDVVSTKRVDDDEWHFVEIRLLNIVTRELIFNCCFAIITELMIPLQLLPWTTQQHILKIFRAHLELLKFLVHFTLVVSPEMSSFHQKQRTHQVLLVVSASLKRMNVIHLS